MTTRRDLTGQRFSHLVAQRPTKHPSGRTAWPCQCDCGNEVIISPASNLTGGNSKSCGCHKHWGHRRTHGMRYSKIYAVWCTMRARCNNPNVKSFKNYGGRGIYVCKRWQTFENFFADMGNPPPGQTLDRIDNNREYEKSNCRWATRLEQRHNRRDKKLTSPSRQSAPPGQ